MRVTNKLRGQTSSMSTSNRIFLLHKSTTGHTHIKNGDTSQFLFEITVEILTAELIPQLVRLYNSKIEGGQTLSRCFDAHYLEHATFLFQIVLEIELRLSMVSCCLATCRD